MLIVKNMSRSTIGKRDDHFRCSNDFYHIYSKNEIEYIYGKNKSVYLCPKSGCGGILKLYQAITDEEYIELKKIKYFEDL